MTPLPTIRRREEPSYTLLAVNGEIIVGDEGFSAAFVREVAAALDSGARRIVVCLDARHLTSTALGAVIESSLKARERGGALTVYSLRPTLRAVFKVLVHTGIFFDTEERALAALNGQPLA